MAKQQSFGDKLKKKKHHELFINVKVIKGYKNDDGSLHFVEKFVKVMDTNELDKIDISK